jgi:flagellar motility protein MotE (MotC chaperone)
MFGPLLRTTRGVVVFKRESSEHVSSKESSEGRKRDDACACAVDEIAEQVVTAQRRVSTVRVDLAQMREGIETAHATARRLSTVEARQEGLHAEFCELVSQMQVRRPTHL